MRCIKEKCGYYLQDELRADYRTCALWTGANESWPEDMNRTCGVDRGIEYYERILSNLRMHKAQIRLMNELQDGEKG